MNIVYFKTTIKQPKMCGRTVNVVHLFVIGPVILLSAYYNWTTPLYILGGGVILIHGWKFINEVLLATASEKPADAPVQVGVQGNGLVASGPYRTTKRANSACNACSSN